MNVLGIGDHISCGSALLRDGAFTSVIIDERLVREKMVFGVPRESIRKVMEESGIGPGDIDRVAVATVNQHLIDHYVDFRGGWFGLDRGRVKQFIFDVASVLARARSRIPFLPSLYYLTRRPFYARRRRALGRIFREEFDITAPVEFVDHHYCHATSAYYSSGFDDALVITVDGGGDGISSKVYDVTAGHFTQLHEVSSFDSLGAFYSYITQICGFKAGRHEGKITGLAASGEPKYVDMLRSLIRFEDGTFKNVGNIFFNSALAELRRRLPDDFDRADLSASIQTHTEEMVVRYVEHWRRKTGRRDVALAGGLFGNVAVNRKVHECDGVDRVFICPGMSDEGMPVGAALSGYYDHGATRTDRPLCFEHVYLGPRFDDDAIEAALRKQGVTAEKHVDVEKEIARLLADGWVVARFAGRMEYGPRALGNRSILYQPTDPSVNDWLNEGLQRTEFMPFAPMTLAEEASRCYLNMQGAERTARFMTITFVCSDWMKASCPGVVHVDGTARPQIVRQQDNPAVHAILVEFLRLTGLPSIINTSFNMHEEPIVCTPDDAIRAFKLGHLDYLAIGSFVAANPVPIDRPRRALAADGTARRG
ncbi:MAG: carbamoyltransferase [Acidobacteriota bacterium]